LALTTSAGWLGPFRSVLDYRGFIAGSVVRDLQLRYRSSTLGAAWLVLQPLAQILVFTLVFTELMRPRLPGVSGQWAYSVFLCAGLLTWGLFAEIVNRSLVMFLENANLLKKISFPRLCLPVIVVANALISFAVVFGLFVVFLLVSSSFPGGTFVAVLPLTLLLVLFAVGLGVGLGVLNVFFRDVGQAMAIVLQFWFWLTPIVYPVAALPAWAQSIVAYNPLTPLITAFQDSIGGRAPDWSGLLPLVVLSLALCVGSLALFRRRAAEIVDEL
jgi:lipopolysaccharide transport system permease protein